MSRQFSEPVPGGAVSGRKTVRRQAQGLVLEYVVASTAGDRLTARLSDRVPTGAAEEFGFHEDHEPEEWTLSDGVLEMAVPLDPGAERTVVFGLVAEGDEFPYEPADPSVDVEVGDAGDPADGSTGDGDGAGDGAGRDGDDGDDDGDATDDGGGFFDGAGPSLEDGDAEGGVDLPDPDDPDQQPAAAGEAPRVDADGGLVDAGRRSAGGVVSTLVDELEAGTVSESELDTLRDHLGVERPESEAARLDYVQKRIGDFDAYVDALEELLSVHGSGEDAVTELEGRLEGFADDVEALRRRQDELADRVDELAAALDTHAETVESLQVAHEEDVAEVRSELRRQGETVREEVAELRRAVDADLAALEAEVEAFESIRRTLVDGLRRPEEAAGDAAVGDVDPDADTSEGSDEPSHDDGRATDWSPDRDRDVEESLEAAEASNFSGASTADDGDTFAPGEDDAEDAAPGADDAAGTEADPVLSLEASEDDERPGASDDRERVDDERADDERMDKDNQTDEEQTHDDERIDRDGPADDGFVAPVLDDGDSLDESGDGGTDTAGAEDGDVDGSEDGAADADSVEEKDVDDTEAGDDDDGDDADEAVGFEVPELDGDDETEAEGAGDDGRATSIFEIGDVDSEAPDAEEKPTIDFEDH